MPMNINRLEAILRRADAATSGTLSVVERDMVWKESEWLGEFLRPVDAEFFACARSDVLDLIQELGLVQSLLKKIHDDWEAGVLPPYRSASHEYPLMRVAEFLVAQRDSITQQPHVGDGSIEPSKAPIEPGEAAGL